MKLTIEHTSTTEINITKKQMGEVTIAYLKTFISDPKMEFIRKVKGKSIWMYDDPYHRHGSVTEYEFREATPEELLIYNTLNLIK